MQTAMYILLTINFCLLIGIAIDVSKTKEMVESLKDDSRQFMYLMQKLVDRLDGKDGDGDG